MVIGFATSCMNRRWQLEATLPENLAVLRGTPHFLAIVDYGSADAVERFVELFRADVAAGTLLFFRTDEPRSFHASIAKNTAHRLALHRQPMVLFNLDADNFITPETVALVEETFREAPSTCLHNASEADDGAFGRIALRAEDWRALGGYDERLLPTSWQDIDLLYRCRSVGLSYRACDRGLRTPVPNTFAQKMVNLGLGGEATGDSPAGAYFSMRRQNLTRSLAGGAPRLSFLAQRRFRGYLNFSELLTL